MIELGLQRISRLLSLTPLRWRAVHVAGTNGKGSTCAYISAMLQAYNLSEYRISRGQKPLRHGRFTSPHLVDRWDCITTSVDDGARLEPVSSALFDQVEKSVLTRCQEEKLQATEFELLTATAFEIFNRSALDVVVVEVGVGGRLDSTNIIGQPAVGGKGAASTDADMASFRPPPLVTAIAKIGMDHQGLLGDTIEEIAAEKAGIIKPGVPVVFDSSNDAQVQDVIKAIAKSNKSPVIDRNTIDLPDLPASWAAHTRQNIEVAFLTTWTLLTSMGRIHSSPYPRREEVHDEQDLQSAMVSSAERTVFPGRQEWIDISSLSCRKDLVLLDGAHNPQSAHVLADKVQGMRISTKVGSGETGYGYDPITWVVAMSTGKPLTDFWEPLLKTGDNVFAVEFGSVDGMPWVQPTSASDILEAAKAVVPNLGITEGYGLDVVGAIQAASTASEKTPGAKLVIAGSLYLVGDVHRYLREKLS